MPDTRINPYSPADIKAALARSGIAYSKRFGQNFLISPHAADAIIKFAGVARSDTVLEIGAGLLGLTYKICERAGKVVSFEIDRGLFSLIAKVDGLPGNLTLLNNDFLECDIPRLLAGEGPRIKVVSNLPYSSSSQILVKVLEHSDLFIDATLTFQKEMADRILSSPSSKEYGTLSILASLRSSITPGPKLKPQIFMPSPKVLSQTLRFTFKRDPLLATADFRDFGTFIKSLFAYRRKKIPNTLKNALKGPGNDEILVMLEKSSISSDKRVENLSPEEVLTLFKNAKQFLSLKKAKTNNPRHAFS